MMIAFKDDMFHAAKRREAMKGRRKCYINDD